MYTASIQNFETYESFESFKAKKKAEAVKQQIKQAGANIKKGTSTATAKVAAKVNPVVKKMASKVSSPAAKLAVVAKNSKGVAKEAATLALIVPYYPVMRVMIQKRGVKPETKPTKLIQQFYTLIVQGKQNFTEYDSQSFESYLRLGHGENGENFAYATVIPACIAFLKKAVELIKKRGDKKEQQAVNEAEGLMKAAMDKNNSTEATEEISNPGVKGRPSGSSSDSSNMLLYGGLALAAVAVVIIAISARKK